jgi:hypothetical protein
MITGIERLQAVPPLIMLVILVLIAWQAAGRRAAIVVAVCLVALGLSVARGLGPGDDDAGHRGRLGVACACDRAAAGHPGRQKRPFRGR